MQTFTYISIYILVWWLTFFCVLPLDMHYPEKPGKGEMAGIPTNPHLKRKAIVTTLIAAVLWLVIFLLIKADVFSYHDTLQQMRK